MGNNLCLRVCEWEYSISLWNGSWIYLNYFLLLGIKGIGLECIIM